MRENKLSVTVITLNEKKDLPRALSSVKELADEIVVVDSGSTDNTLKIAKKFGVKIYKRKFDNYARQKNFAAKKTTGYWILSLDADEEISPMLSDEINNILNNEDGNNGYNAYSIPRRNIIFGKYIKYSRWQPELDRHVWLWKKNKGRWVGNVHEELKVDGKVGKLKGAKIHYQYETVGEFMQMMNTYSELDAQITLDDGKDFSYLNLFGQPIYNFMVRYFYRLGFLDGWRGFILSYLMAVYHFQLWVKVWKKGNL